MARGKFEYVGAPDGWQSIASPDDDKRYKTPKGQQARNDTNRLAVLFGSAAGAIAAAVVAPGESEWVEFESVIFKKAWGDVRL